MNAGKICNMGKECITFNAFSMLTSFNVTGCLFVRLQILKLVPCVPRLSLHPRAEQLPSFICNLSKS